MLWLCLKPQSLEHYLSQEDPGLLGHLRAVGAVPRLPYALWFRRCFAGCLPESSLQRCASSWPDVGREQGREVPGVLAPRKANGVVLWRRPAAGGL